MHSSISSSNDRVPAGRWGVIWAASLAMSVLAIGGWEWFVRVRGLSDTAVTDTVELWLGERERASALGDRAVLLIGASRIQLGMNLRIMQQYTEGIPVQLAISAASFMPVLEHLANDETITGTVIVSFTPQYFVWSARDTQAEKWIAAYDDYMAGKTAVFYQPLEDALRGGVDSVFKALAGGARPQQLIFGQRIKNYVRTLPDRSQQADYSKVDREAAYRRRVELVLSGKEAALEITPDLDARLDRLESMVGRITARGGKVIFVRFPSSKRILEIERIRYPRHLYWDRLTARTGARTIHYADYPELRGYDLPDGVHMDVKDQEAFSRALSRLIFAIDDGD